MSSPTLRRIKHAQRESYFHKEIVSLLQRIIVDDPLVSDLFVTRVSLSQNRGSCIVFLGTLNATDAETFEKKLRQLVLYKPSIRSSLAKVTQTRTVPELIFKFDDRLIKQQRLDKLLLDIAATPEQS